MSDMIFYAIPAFLVTMALEASWARRERRLWNGAPIRGYAPRDTLASLAMGLGNVGIAAVVKLAVFGLWSWAHALAPLRLPVAWWSWLLLFFADDLVYYAFHRASHEVRLLWAAHVNHHSSQHYNLSTALRQSWTTPITGIPFWLPLAFLGFEPWMILTQQAISLLYQYWLHTESIGRLGPLEWIFNTPSHHRVHHGSNPEYLDRNHGGILIVWDRLFGTYAPERAPVRYGLTRNLTSHHPVTIAFHEWAAMLRDARGGGGWRAIFGPPGGAPTGATKVR
jgi:sterol desaturase/sphingolipid hydroxylase (fatty acid hydroxylase superfamily)